MELRRARIEDAGTLAELFVRTWHFTYRGIFSDAFLDGLDPVEQASAQAEKMGRPGTVIFVAEVGGELLGACRILICRDGDAGPEVAEIAGIDVQPDRQRAGIGRRLFRAAVAEAGRWGCSRLTLWVMAENWRARAFYEAMGLAWDGAEKPETRIPGAEGRDVPTTVRYAMELGRG